MSFEIIGDIKPLLLTELKEGYNEDRETNKVVAYFGRLQVRPDYQRQFIYEEKEMKAVILTILKKRPLGIMYFVQDGLNYEVMDGQQRIMSICKFMKGDYSVKWNGEDCNYDKLSEEDKEQFDNYELKYYLCNGNDYQAKLDWFKTINVGGKPLSDQEMRNAMCGGIWIKTLKKNFSSKEFLSKYKELVPTLSTENLERFIILERIFNWLIAYEGFSSDSKDPVFDFMEHYKNSDTAVALSHIEAFKKICKFARENFNTSNKDYQKFLKFQTINWGRLAKLGTSKSPDNIKSEINALLGDTEVTKPGKICEYIITGDKRILYERQFSDKQKQIIWMNQGCRCGNKHCPNPKISVAEGQFHHKVAFDDGGATTIDNGVFLCKECHKAWHNKDNSNFEFI